MAQPETRLQKRCRMFLDAFLPPPSWFSSVGRERKQSRRQGADQNARGFKRGLPDIMIWAPSFFLGIELKSDKGRMQPDQLVFQARMAALGHGYAVVRSVEALGETLQENGVPIRLGWRIKAQLHDLELETEPPTKKRASSKPRAPSPTRGQARVMGRLAKAGVFTA